MVDLYLLCKIGARLDPEIKMSENFFKTEFFADSIVNFYERVKGKPVDKDYFPIRTGNQKPTDLS